MELSKNNLDSIQDMAKALEAENFKLQLKDKAISLSKEDIEKEQKNLEGVEEEKQEILTGHISKIKSDTCRYIVVSGMTEASLRAMRQDGIMAASVVETNQDKFQAIVKTAAPRSREESQKLAEMRETLCNRYGNGIKETEVAVPGMHYKDEGRVCRTVSMNTIAPRLGISRLQERIQEKDGVYTKEEEVAKAYAAAQQQGKTEQLIEKIEKGFEKIGVSKEELNKAMGYGEQKSKPIFDEKPKKEEEEQKQEKEQEKYEVGVGGSILAIILKVIKDLIMMIINGARQAVAKMQEEKQAAKEPWGDKRPYPDNELAKGTVLERGGFAKEQEQQQEKGRSVKDIIRQAGNAAQEQEAQKQAEAAKARPGIMAGPNRDIEEATLSR